MNKDKDFSTINRFLLWCAGIDIELLKTCSNTVISKYIALGGLVLTPAFFAFPSACYFLLDTLLPKKDWAIYIAVLIGLVWSLVVLNFDRYLVISFNKSGSAFKDLFSLSIMLRNVMAGLISIIIAHPLVLSMFHKNIEESLANKRTQQRENIKQIYNDNIKNLDKQINDLIAKNTKTLSVDVLTEDSSTARELKTKIEAKEKEINTTQIEYSCEVAGCNESRTKKFGSGPVSITIQDRLITLKKQISDLNTELQQVQSAQKANVQFKKNMLIKDSQNVQTLREINSALINEQIDGIKQLKVERQRALENFDSHLSLDFLTFSNELDVLSKENENVRVWKWLLTGLLFIIDIFAVFLKVLSDLDEYDDKKHTVSLFETNEQKAKRDAHQQSETDRVWLEYTKEQYKLKKEGFECLCVFNINKMAILPDYFYKHYAQVDRFKKMFIKHSVQSNDYGATMGEYTRISDSILNDTLSHFVALEEK